MRVPTSVFGLVVVVVEAISAPDDESLLQTVSKSRQPLPDDITLGATITVEGGCTCPGGQCILDLTDGFVITGHGKCQGGSNHGDEFPRGGCNCQDGDACQDTADGAVCTPGYAGTPGCLNTPFVTPIEECNQEDAPRNIGPREQGGCQVCKCDSEGQWICTGQIRNRKEIADITDDEFAKFADAVNILKWSGEWDEVTMMHGIVEEHAHRSNRFLHWHRKYLFDLETMVQAAANSCEVTLPYWNWGYDMGMAGTSVPHVWGDNRYGALVGDHICDFGTCGICLDDQIEVGPGEFINNERVGDPFFCNRCPVAGGTKVTGGRFGAGSAWDVDLGDYTIPRPGPPPTSMADARLRQVGNPFGALYRCWTGGPVNTQPLTALYGELEDYFSSGNLSVEFPQHPDMARTPDGRPDWNGINDSSKTGVFGLVTYVETQWHNSPHCAIGGFMCGFSSPQDPVFWAHHAFVDKIWFDWQQTHLTQAQKNWTDQARADQANGASELWNLPWNLCGAEPASLNATIPASEVEDSMDMFGGKGKVNYLDRSKPVACSAQQYKKLQCCSKQFSSNTAWHKVTRLSTDANATFDDCSPANGHTQQSNLAWLHTLVQAGTMDEQQATADFNKAKLFTERLEDITLKKLSSTETTECEMSLCLPLTEFFTECDALSGDTCGVSP